MKNCINCGAPLQGGKCAYCGTEYNEDHITADFGVGDMVGVISIGGVEYTCYLSHMEAYPMFFPDCGRDMSGKFIRSPGVLKHKFTLIEV